MRKHGPMPMAGVGGQSAHTCYCKKHSGGWSNVSREKRKNAGHVPLTTISQVEFHGRTSSSDWASAAATDAVDAVDAADATTATAAEAAAVAAATLVANMPFASPTALLFPSNLPLSLSLPPLFVCGVGCAGETLRDDARLTLPLATAAARLKERAAGAPLSSLSRPLSDVQSRGGGGSGGCGDIAC